MLTVTPDDVNTPTNVRLATRQINNTNFPAAADEKFFDAIRSGSTLVQDAAEKEFFDKLNIDQNVLKGFQISQEPSEKTCIIPA